MPLLPAADHLPPAVRRRRLLLLVAAPLVVLLGVLITLGGDPAHGLAARFVSHAAAQQQPAGGATKPTVVTTTDGHGKPQRPAIHGRHVLVIGDSVLLGTEEEDALPHALKSWKVRMNCVGGRRLPEDIELMKHKGRHLGNVVIIQAGNNYIPGEDGTFAHQIKQAMHAMRHVQLVIWVTVADIDSDRRIINRAIRAAPAKYPTVKVADWQPLSDGHPGYTYDKLHLTPTGRARMCKLLAHTLGKPPHRA